MDTNILTPRDLFQKVVRYTVPPFQRRYVWSQDDQWEPLWNDVCNVAEEYLEKLENSNNEVEAEEQTGPHFLGAVVIQQVPTASKYIGQREVIDGQQRVTTLQILLNAIRIVCEEKNLKHHTKRLWKFVFNDKDSIGDDDDHAFKLWPTRGDQEAFREAMNNGPTVIGLEDSKIVRAHDFFLLQVRVWIGDDANSFEHRMDALEAAVTSKLQMVVIDLDTRDDPNVIFETLNARGTPLEQSDLIKNYVLSKANKDDIWGDLEDDWWQTQVRQGRLYRPRLDMLLNYWLAMRKGNEVAPLKVFHVFQECVEDQDLDIVMLDVKQDLANYKKFETGNRTSEENRFYNRMNVMQAGVITPVLLLLLRVEHERRVRAFNALESFLVRRMICRQTTKDYNRLTLDLAVKLEKDGLGRADAVVSGFLMEQKAEARKWLNDQELKHSLESSPVYRLLTRGRLRLVLEGIEEQLRRSPKAEQPDVPQNLTIEHLMPQGWEGKWSFPTDTDEESGKFHRNINIHTIGNLTLANNKLNSSMSNDLWEEKREELKNHSTLLLNSELISESQWNEESILIRSRKMADLISRFWPGPDPEIWNS